MASFVDVPGHERFVRNMLAGAHGIDAVLLVVAADESVMPQTREHFDICRLLGVPRGLVALTKCDVADAGAARRSPRSRRASSWPARSWRGARACASRRAPARGCPRCGRRSWRWRRAAARRPERGPAAAADRPRLHACKGFGTVVTGTLVAGHARGGRGGRGPALGRRARVRGLQVHGAARRALGRRHAHRREPGRGRDRGARARRRAGAARDAARDVDARRRARAAARTRSRSRTARGSACTRRAPRCSPACACSSRVRSRPGRRALAQLRLESPAGGGARRPPRAPLLLAGRHDRRRARRRPAAAAAPGRGPRRRSRACATPPAWPRRPRPSSREAGTAGIEAPLLAARLTVAAAELAQALARQPGARRARGGAGRCCWRAALSIGCRRRRSSRSSAFHRENPLRPAMPREELRAPGVRHGARRRASSAWLEELAAAGRVRLLPDAVGLARTRGAPQPPARRRRAAAAGRRRGGGARGRRARGARGRGRRGRRAARARGARARRRSACWRAWARACSSSAGQLEALKQQVRERWPTGSRIEVGEFKELTGLSRKYVIPLLEYLDRERVTRRVGAFRVVV